ncbi:MAG: hypothetical protein FWE76_07770, partial [Symbiobacteriaceae bacterium]|nr:hypothetical protein [Symbiobacteriaceae bacterium]
VQRSQGISEVRLDYFDAMVIRPANAPPISAMVSMPGQSLRMIGYSNVFTGWDEVLEATVKSNFGTLPVLGIPLEDRSSYEIPLTMFIDGGMIKNPHDIIIPETVANEFSLSPGDTLHVTALAETVVNRMQFTITGVFIDNSAYTPCLISIEDAKVLLNAQEANCYLLKQKETAPEKNIPYYLTRIYPQGQVTYRGSALALAAEQMTHVQKNSGWLRFFMLCFFGIAIFTIVFITHLERRNELAMLRACGISNKQIFYLFTVEYGLSELLGIFAGGTLIVILVLNLEVFHFLSGLQHVQLAMTAVLVSVLMTLLTLTLPVATSVSAGVNQFLYNRTIPIFRKRINEGPQNVYTRTREAETGGVALKLPEVDGKPDCLLLKNNGEQIMRGEIIAVLESLGGLYLQEWVSPCDGTILSIDSGGYVVIRPNGSDV